MVDIRAKSGCLESFFNPGLDGVLVVVSLLMMNSAQVFRKQKSLEKNPTLNHHVSFEKQNSYVHNTFLVSTISKQPKTINRPSATEHLSPGEARLQGNIANLVVASFGKWVAKASHNLPYHYHTFDGFRFNPFIITSIKLNLLNTQ